MIGTLTFFAALTAAYLYNGIDDAQNIANETLFDATNKFNKNGGGHNDEGDAWRHAEWNKRMSKKLGIDRALIYSTVNEFWNFRNKKFKMNPINEFKMDMFNNFKGAFNFNKSTDELIKNNKLIIINGENKNYPNISNKSNEK